ncbi:MAG: flavin-containing monooxygenase [Pseudomonadota bacterium]
MSLRQFDAVIVGAGMSGIYQLLKLRELGLSVRVIEAGSGVGGTWYWNRYPGARFDSESYSYCYSFSDELLQEWDWSEHFSPQPETLRYLEHVADKFDLRSDIVFNKRVSAATWIGNSHRWQVETEDGEQVLARFLITAIGPLSQPTYPDIEGMDDYQGFSCHTARWPKEPVDFAGKTVGIIGTGATGVQVIQEVAKTAGHLYVFQRTPNWCAPLNNSKITPEEQAKVKESYPEIFEKCLQNRGCFLHTPVGRNTFDDSEEERQAFYEQKYAEPGFGIWVGTYQDTLLDEKANAEISRFVANKIRSRVNDRELAEKLIPDNHGFGTRRVPLETKYYEVFNQRNVTLVDLRDTPIERITTSGVRTTAEDYDLDILIYATGFDAVTGAFDHIDIRGKAGISLSDRWEEQVATYLGIQVVGFPNMFTLVGPQNSATLCNIPRCIEQNVEWVTETIGYMEEQGASEIEPLPQSQKDWTQLVADLMSMSLFMKVRSWISGINLNVPGRDKPRYVVFPGGAPMYKELCDNEAASGYPGFRIS